MRYDIDYSESREQMLDFSLGKPTFFATHLSNEKLLVELNFDVCVCVCVCKLLRTHYASDVSHVFFL